VKVPAARVVFSAADRAEIARAACGSLGTGSLTLGPHTAAFEAAFAAAHRARHAVAVSSGTAALEIILRILDVEGRDVVVPANTFFATAAAVLHAGGRPVFADVEADSFALSPQSLQDALTPRTRAVVLVHIGGLITPRIDKLRALCDDVGVPLVEDAAHAHGSSFDGRFAGGFGIAAGFSFYPTKVITAGEGGMILTADERIAAEARIYRDQGKAGFGRNEHVRIGYAWRMSELHAAVGEVHLRHLTEFVARRQAVAAAYDEALAGIPGIEPLEPGPGTSSNYYKYLAVLDEGIDRDRLKTVLREEYEVVLAGEVYEIPLHLQPVFAEPTTTPEPDGRLPVAEDVCARHVCLPVHSDMTDDEVAHVVTSLAAALEALLTEAGTV
jgi:perosamine synthetase